MIRKGTIKDRDQILKIYNDAKDFINSYNSPQWQDGYPNLDTFLSDVKNDRLYVYEIGDLVVACASFHHYDQDYNEIYDGSWLTSSNNYIAVHTIAVLREFHGKGISNQFFEYAFDNFPIDSIRIDTHEQNVPMIKMLNRVGFHYCGVVYLRIKKDNKRLAFERLRS